MVLAVVSGCNFLQNDWVREVTQRMVCCSLLRATNIFRIIYSRRFRRFYTERERWGRIYLDFLCREFEFGKAYVNYLLFYTQVQHWESLAHAAVGRLYDRFYRC